MSTTTRTIRRNTKRHRQIIETAHDCRVYTLDNQFNAADCNPLALVRYCNGSDYLGKMGKLASNHKGGYTLHIHDNLWFEFEADA